MWTIPTPKAVLGSFLIVLTPIYIVNNVFIKSKPKSPLDVFVKPRPKSPLNIFMKNFLQDNGDIAAIDD
jgi:hypothetical protein